MFLSTVVVVLVVSLTSIVNCEDADCNNDDEGEHCCLSCCPKLLTFTIYQRESVSLLHPKFMFRHIDLISYILVTGISKNSLRCS